MAYVRTIWFGHIFYWLNYKRVWQTAQHERILIWIGYLYIKLSCLVQFMVIFCVTTSHGCNMGIITYPSVVFQVAEGIHYCCQIQAKFGSYVSELKSKSFSSLQKNKADYIESSCGEFTRGVHKLTFFWPSQVTNHKSSAQVNSQVSSKSLVQVQVKSN